MERATRTAEREKSTARSFPGRPSRDSITYMGPPIHCPLSSRRRYFTERRHSENLVARAGRELSSIHTRAPGPPEVRAAATPTILPVPMVAERAVIKAEKGLTPPLLACRDSLERARRRAFPIFRRGKKRVRRDKKTPVPNKSAMVPPPQRAARRVKRNSMDTSPLFKGIYVRKREHMKAFRSSPKFFINLFILTGSFVSSAKHCPEGLSHFFTNGENGGILISIL